MRRLDGTSAMMVYTDGPRHYQHTLKIAIIDAPDHPAGFDYADLLSRMESTLDSVPYLKWKLAMPPFGINHPYWIQDLEFDLSHHVIRIACPSPGDRKAFCELIANLFIQPLDRSMPLWKLWVIEGLEGNRIALVNMLHHAYTDGTGFSNLLTSLVSSGELPVLTSEEFGVDSKKNPSRLWMFVDSLLSLPVIIFRSLRNLRQSSIKLRKTKQTFEDAGKPLPPQPLQAPSSPFNTVLTHGRTFYYDGIPFDEFKSVAKSHGVTVNELLMAVATGAIRSYYQQRDLPMEEALIASIAINMRTPEQMKEIMGNYVSSSYASLPIQIDDALERLAAVRQSSQTMKDYVKATQGISFLDTMSIMPPAAADLMDWVGRKTKGKLGMLGNLVISNVSGPSEFIPVPQLDGKVVDWLSMGGLGFNLGLNITAWRYVDKLNVCIMADKTVVPDGEEFMSYLAKAFEEYKIEEMSLCN